MKQEDFEAIHGKLPAHATYIDLDDPANQVPPERITAGWSDTQIASKSLTEIDAMINSGELAISNMRDTLYAEEERISGLRQVRQRKLALGGD